jgi:hypothetical protein
MQKKAKKDELITLEGEVGNIITPQLLQVSKKNLAVLDNISKKVKELELVAGDVVRVTYKNGILMTIDLVTKSPKIVHMDKQECRDKTAELTVETPVKKDITSESPAVNPAVCPDAGDLELSPPTVSDVHIHNKEKTYAELVKELRVDVSIEQLKNFLKGKSYLEIYELKEVFDKIAKDENVKDTIDAFDKHRLEGAIVADAENVGIGSVWGHDFDNTIYEHGTRYDYKITLIIPESEEERNERELKEQGQDN